MPFLIEMPHLVSAARACMRRSGAPGADGITWARYRQGMRERLADLSDRLRAHTWAPGPIREVQITSYTGKVFTAAIPTVEDRIVHRAMRRALDPILEQHVLHEWVSAYRPGRSRITALRQARAHLDPGRTWIADLDVEGASRGGTVQQYTNWLAGHVSDGTFLRLFSTVLADLPSPMIPGSGLWPVLFHLRLTQVDEHLGALAVVRFADNYLVFAPDEPGAQDGFEAVAAALATVGLRPHPDKSRIRAPHHANAEDLFLIDG